MENVQELTIGSALKTGWEKVKGQLWLVIGAAIVVILVSGGMSVIIAALAETGSGVGGFLSFILNVAHICISLVVSVGFLKLFLNIYDGKPASLRDLFIHYRFAWRYFLASLLYSLIVFGGLILLIIPGIYFMVKYQFIYYLIVDKDMKVMEALKLAGQMTKDKKWWLIGLSIVSGLVAVAGFLLLLVGALATIPLVAMAYVHVYRVLLKKVTSAPAEKTAVPKEVAQAK